MAASDTHGIPLECNGNLTPRSLKAWQLLASSHWSDIIDVGATDGEMLLNLEMPASARCVAEEPNPALASLLKRSIAEEKLAIQGCEMALGKAAGGASMRPSQPWLR